MDQKFNILVFPSGSEIGLEIYRSLQYSQHINLIGLSSIDDHGKYEFENYIGNAPFIDSEEVIPFLADLVAKNRIDAIYPTMDSVIEKLKRNEKAIGCKIICSDHNTTEICLSKIKTYKYLGKYVKVPVIYDSIEDIIEYPVFLKPEAGYGSRNVYKADNRKEVIGFLEKNKNHFISEFLPGAEYTVDCFTDRKGKLRFVGPRVRNRISNGISVNTSGINDNNEFVKIAETINNRIPFRGAWFFQMKEDKCKSLTLLEIASRLGGSSGLHRCLGVNLALLSVYDIFDIDIEIIINNYEIELDRALSNKYKLKINYDTIYVDLDDCLIIRQKINLNLIKFLYQAVNENKNIILLTKHKGDVTLALKKYRLSELFDSVITLEMDDEKHYYIKDNFSIFIDDSFSERFKIKKKLNIPVFSPDMVECLLV